MHHFLGKPLAENVVTADGKVLAKEGAILDETTINAILASGDVREVKVRNHTIEGIEMEAITEGKNNQTVIGSLRDRIVGRHLAEDIENAKGKIVYHINEYITDDMADKIRRTPNKRSRFVPY